MLIHYRNSSRFLGNIGEQKRLNMPTALSLPSIWEDRKQLTVKISKFCSVPGGAKCYDKVQQDKWDLGEGFM